MPALREAKTTFTKFLTVQGSAATAVAAQKYKQHLRDLIQVQSLPWVVTVLHSYRYNFFMALTVQIPRWGSHGENKNNTSNGLSSPLAAQGPGHL